MRADAADRFWLPLAGPEVTLPTAGGKGASLARLARLGLPVPAGFHLTTAAYRHFVDTNGLQPAILAAAEAVGDDVASQEAAAAAIAARVANGALPAEIAAAITEGYAALGAGEPAVAVRSSATAEDLPGTSFAGQQETRLNVRGEAALLDAVRRCWASLWSARAIAYRRRMGVDHTAVAIAVVVQKMVPAEAAGVLFTANPTTGARDELVVNASFGLGEAVVGGRVTPDSYRLDKGTLAVKERTIGSKELLIVPTGQGTTVEAVAEERRREAALTEPMVRELGELARRVEAEFDGRPMDIEWAVADGKVWLLQARPMTGLPPAPLVDVRWEPPIAGTRWVRRQVVENMPEPLSPLFAEFYLGDALAAGFDLAWSELGVPEPLDEVINRPLFTTIHGFGYMGINIRWRWETLRIYARAIHTAIPRLFKEGVPFWRDRALPAYLAEVERWRAIEPSSLPDERLIEGMRALARAEALYWAGVTLAIAVAKSSDTVLDWFLAVLAPRHGLSSGRFLRGFQTRALAAEAELEAIADRARASAGARRLVDGTPPSALLAVLEREPAGRALLAEVQRYLHRYGHRLYTLDFAEPTQGENPAPVLLALRDRVRRAGRDLAARQAEIARERDRLIAETARSFDPLRRRWFLGLVRWASQFGPYREDPLFYVGFAWPPLRRLALELGRRLQLAGSLAAPDDVFFLEQAELRAASEARHAGAARPDLARLAQERRELREARRRLHPPATVPPSFRLKLGPISGEIRESQRRNPATGPTLRGFAVSPGRVTAPASVVLSADEVERMAAGTILVCPTTTPAWTPLFAQAAGLVTDIGGVAAHGSIIAREYGIPAVMGVGSGTVRIAHGQTITVDGDAGLVTLAESAAAGGEAPPGRRPDPRPSSPPLDK